MGVDIHFAFQARNNKKDNWKNIEFSDNIKLYRNNIFDGRNSLLFELLTNLTIDLQQIGCPDLLKDTKLYYDNEWELYDWDTTDMDCLFDFGFITLKQFKKAVKDLKDSLLNGTWVSQDFVEKFLASGGEFPDEFTFVNDDFKIIYNEDKYLLEILDELIKNFNNISNYFDLKDSNLRICWYFDC